VVVPGVAPSLKDAHDSYVSQCQPVLPVNNGVLSKRLEVSSRLVGFVNMAVVARVGNLEDTRANRLLVKSVALKIMREASFRNDVINLHIEYVIQSFFDTRSHHHRAGGAARRCPKWLLKAMGFKSVSLPGSE